MIFGLCSKAMSNDLSKSDFIKLYMFVIIAYTVITGVEHAATQRGVSADMVFRFMSQVSENTIPSLPSTFPI